MRLLLIDSLRGFAFILMFIQHLFYFYDVSNYYRTSYSNNKFIKDCGSISRYLFLFLVGYSLSLSYKNNSNFYKNIIKKSLIILFHALILSLFTKYLYPEFYIRFGILHFIGVSTLLLLFLMPLKNFPLLFVIISLYLSCINLPKIITNNSYINLMLGSNQSYYMMDYFSINEWIPVVIFGMFIESILSLKINNTSIIDILINILKLNFLNDNKYNINNILSTIGKNSLNLYTLHIIIILLFYKLKFIKNK